ncbi:PemK-like protein [Paenibacillus lautus]|uniref:PemK-like protein n=1 Tax=Paenibacillus lautus TaxID=1401 RepID=UPI003D2DAA78
MEHLNAFSDYDKWSEISKQSIFEAWVPYVSDRPLQFFIPKHGSDNEGYLTDVIADSTNESEHKIVTELKRRRVLILTSDELCKSKTFPDILVAKIVSIKERHREQNWYKNHLVNDTHPLYVHLGKDVTGEESYINLAQPMTIGKKMLIQNYNKVLGPDRMALVEDRYARLVSLGVIKTADQAVNE